MKRNSKKGFTLVELLVTLVVGGVLVTIAAPSFQGAIARNRVATLTNEMVGSLNIARSEAIKRGVRVTVCKSSDQLTCTGTWSDGWIVFSDEGVKETIDGGDEILRIHGDIGQGRSFEWYGEDESSSSVDAVSFLSTGFTSAGVKGTFTTCDSTDNVKNARGIVISKTGQTRLSIDSDTNGIHEDKFGNALTCS